MAANDDRPKPVTIAGDGLRKELVLTANATNQSVIWLGGEENSGTPLSPNEKITLTMTNPLTVLGQAGDWLYVAELCIKEAA